MKRRIVSVCFGLYIVLMLWLLFAQRIGQTAALYGSYWETLRWNLNWVPFRTIREMLELLRKGSGYLRRFAVINLGGNVGMFLPLGLFLPELWSGMRKFKKFLVTVVQIILTVELVQLFTFLGSGDVDDLLLNVLGASMGYACWKGIRRTVKGRKRRI